MTPLGLPDQDTEALRQKVRQRITVALRGPQDAFDARLVLADLTPPQKQAVRLLMEAAARGAVEPAAEAQATAQEHRASGAAALNAQRRKTAQDRRTVLAAILATRPDLTAQQARDRLDRAGFAVGVKTARDDLKALRAAEK